MNPEAFRLAARLAMTELLMSGCTCANDHHYFFPAGLEDAMDVEAEEAARVGIRMTLTRGSLDQSKEDGTQAVAPKSVTQDDDTILADCERVIGRYHDRSEGAMLQVALAPMRALRRVAPPDARERGARREARLPAAHPSRRDQARGGILPDALRHVGRRLSRASAAG